MQMTLVPRLALGLIAGLCAAGGFAPLSFFPLMLVGILALIWALLDTGPRAGALVGLAFGLGFLGFLVSWVHVLGIGVWLTLVAVQAPFFALFGALFTILQRRPLWPVTTAALWVGVEYLRSQVPLGGFPWGRLAYASTGTPLEAYARVVGVAVLSGLIFGLCATVVYAWLRRDRLRTVVASAASVVAVVAVSLVLPTGVAGAGASHHLAVVQGGVPGTGADGMGQQRQVLENHAAATAAYAAQVRTGEREQPDAVLWPENASDIDPFDNPDAGTLIDSAVQDIGAPILVGAILNGPTPETAANVGIVWDPSTGAGDRYTKRNLVPYGEYVPLRPLVDKLVPFVTREIPRDMISGSDSSALQLGPVTVGDMMCFDVVFDDAARAAVLDGAQLLVVQTNNATYTGTAQPEQQWQIARMRAIEAGRDILVPSINGISGIATADGAELAKSTTNDAVVLTGDVTAGNSVTLGTRLGGWLEILLSLGALVAVVVALARRSRPRSSGRRESADEVSQVG